MNITFYKFHGTGNDFILLDNRNQSVNLSTQAIAYLCNRHLGIGADGLMLLSSQAGYDFSMTYYNADGNEGSMCGNGGRCIVAFAKMLDVIADTAHFIAVDGEHSAEVKVDATSGMYQVKLQMQDVKSITMHASDFILNTGSPHYVTFVNDIHNYDVFNTGKAIRLDKNISTNGVNVNFVEEIDNGIYVRTFERGVEDETLSCGTGSIASALSYSLKNNLTSSKIAVKTLGGDLQIHFKKEDKSFSDIWLEGPAVSVFKGEINV